MTSQKRDHRKRKKLYIFVICNTFSLLFLKRAPHFHFTLGIADYIASPDEDCISQPLLQLDVAV